LELRFNIVADRQRKDFYEAVEDLTHDLIQCYQKLIDEMDGKEASGERPKTSLCQKNNNQSKRVPEVFFLFANNKDYRRRWEARDSIVNDSFIGLNSPKSLLQSSLQKRTNPDKSGHLDAFLKNRG
jgi:SET domain-containing protein